MNYLWFIPGPELTQGPELTKGPELTNRSVQPKDALKDPNHFLEN